MRVGTGHGSGRWAAAWAVVALLLFFTGWGARWRPFETHALHLAALLGLLLSAQAAGRLLARPLGLQAPADGALRLLLGFGAWSLAWLVLAHAGLFRPGPAWAALGLGATAGAALLVRSGSTRRWAAPPLPSSGLAAPALCLVAAVLAAPLLFSPPSSTDELVYHLAVPKSWVAAGSILPAPPSFSHASFPMQTGLLFGWALLLGLPLVAKLVHASLAACALGLAARESARSSGVEGGWGAAAFLATTPVFLTNASWAVVDAALAAYVLAGCLLLARVHAGGGRRAVVAAGLAWGLAIGTKYTAGLYLAFALPLFLWRPGRLREALRSALMVALLAGALAAPWFLRAWAAHGDPIHPFGAALVGQGGEVRVEEMTGRRLGLAGRIAGLLDDSVMTGPADESLGALGLVLVPILLWQRRRLSRTGRRLLYTGLGAALVLHVGFAGSSRFLLPALVLFAVPAGERLGAWWRSRGAASAAATALLVVAALPSLALVAWQSREHFDATRVALGYEGREAWLARTERGHAVLAFANAELPPDARVLALWSTELFWLDRAALVSGPADVPWVRDRLRSSAGLDELVSVLAAEGLTHLLFDAREFQERVLEGPGRAAFEERELALLRRLLDERARLLFASGRVALYELRP